MRPPGAPADLDIAEIWTLATVPLGLHVYYSQAEISRLLSPGGSSIGNPNSTRQC
jgi:hypothetical protein